MGHGRRLSGVQHGRKMPFFFWDVAKKCENHEAKSAGSVNRKAARPYLMPFGRAILSSIARYSLYLCWSASFGPTEVYYGITIHFSPDAASGSLAARWPFPGLAD